MERCKQSTGGLVFKLIRDRYIYLKTSGSRAGGLSNKSVSSRIFMSASKQLASQVLCAKGVGGALGTPVANQGSSGVQGEECSPAKALGTVQAEGGPRQRLVE